MRTFFASLGIVLTIGATQVLAADAPDGKDLCLLYGMNCRALDTTPERIIKLQSEIDKGEKTYTAAELETLKQKLREANEMKKIVTRHGRHG